MVKTTKTTPTAGGRDGGKEGNVRWRGIIGEVTDPGRHRRIGRGRGRKLSAWIMPREFNPCSGGLTLFKGRQGRPRAQQLPQPPKPKLLRRTFGRMMNNWCRCRHNANCCSSVRAVFWPLMSMGSDVNCGDIADRPRGGPWRSAAALQCACYRRPLIRPAPHRAQPYGCSRSRLRLARPPHRRLLTRRTTRHLAPCMPRRRLGSLGDDDGHTGTLAAGPARLGRGMRIANEAYYHQYLSSQRRCRRLW